MLRLLVVILLAAVLPAQVLPAQSTEPSPSDPLGRMTPPMGGRGLRPSACSAAVRRFAWRSLWAPQDFPLRCSALCACVGPLSAGNAPCPVGNS